MPQSFKSLKIKLTKALKPYQPQKIYIYGSYARGEAKRDSDLDVLIIKNTTTRPVYRIGEATRYIYTKENLKNRVFNISIEPIVYTPQEFNEGIEMGHPFIKSINKEKVLIYRSRISKNKTSIKNS